VIAEYPILVGWTGVDYSFGRPDPVELRRLGHRFAVRYISPRIDHPKNITQRELDALWAAGIAVLFVWESTTTRPLEGRAAGLVDGKASRAWCERLGYPSTIPVLIALDTDITKRTLLAALGYIDGFVEELGPWPFGVYADTDVIGAVAGRSVLNWRPNASAWSPNPSTLVHVQQHASRPVAGAVVDTNTALRPFTAWLPHTPPSPPTLTEDDMPAKLIRVDGDAAQYAELGFEAVWGRSAAHIAEKQGTGAWSTEPARVVTRSYLKTLKLVGDEPDYTGVDPAAFPVRTGRADFAPEPRAVLSGSVTVGGDLTVTGR